MENKLKDLTNYDMTVYTPASGLTKIKKILNFNIIEQQLYFLSGDSNKQRTIGEIQFTIKSDKAIWETYLYPEECYVVYKNITYSSVDEFKALAILIHNDNICKMLNVLE